MARHEFEPGKLVAGLVLLVGAVLGAVDAADRSEGPGDLPDWLPAVIVPAGLAVAATIAAFTYAGRHVQRRAAKAAQAAQAPPAELGSMPMDELRAAYERSHAGADADAEMNRGRDRDR